MQSENHTRELTILNAIAQALNQSADLDAALQTTLSKTAELLDLHAGWIWLLNEENGEHYLAAAQNLPPGLARDPRKMEGWCHCVEQYLEGELEEPANVDVIMCSRLKGMLAGTDGLRYHASVPLHAHEKQVGILNVASPDWCELGEDDLRLLYTIGDMVGIAVERARLYARSAELGAMTERNRLAREIHDTLAQGLSAIALQLETADALLESGAAVEQARRAIQQAMELARRNLTEARRSVLDLRAVPLEGRTLTEALTELCQKTAERSGTKIEFAAVGGSRPLPISVEIGLYRIAQEAIGNAVRHGMAKTIQVTLTTTPAMVMLTVEDDGIGFDIDQVNADRYGLIGMNERASLLAGALKIRSSPGVGTWIEALIPLDKGSVAKSNE